MTEVKSEITLKFNELPEAKPEPNKRVEVLLTDQSSVVFRATTNAKSWHKAEADVAAFADRGKSMSCKLGQPMSSGFEVVDASIKVSEKKAKEPQLEVTTISYGAMPVLYEKVFLDGYEGGRVP